VRSTTGHTFGAYASKAWNSAKGYINAAGCFLFLVENPHGDAPTCFECKQNRLAMYGHICQGPTFGSGHDICISDESASAECESYTLFPCSYTDTLGRGDATFTGAEVYTAEEYEVWKATR
jgi:hypothetical protein